MEDGRKRQRLLVIGPLGVILFTACSAGPQTALSRPRSLDQEESMCFKPEDLLQGLPDHPDTVVEVISGVEHFLKGRVRLTVRGDGQVEVQNTRAGKEFRYQYRLSRPEVAALGAEFVGAGFTTLKTRDGPREPGDSPVVLRLWAGDKVVHEASLWYADRYDLPGLETILSRYETIVSGATKGELPY